MKFHLRKTVIFTALILHLILLASPLPGASSGYPEYNVKAELVFRIAEFVDWPDKALNTSKTFRIALLENNLFGKYIYEIARNEKIHNFPVQIIEDAKEIDSLEFQVVFIGRCRGDKLTQIIKKFSGRPVLIIGDTEECLSVGAHIGLNVINQKIRFSINLDAANQSGLQFSSGLLRLAHKIYGINQK